MRLHNTRYNWITKRPDLAICGNYEYQRNSQLTVALIIDNADFIIWYAANRHFFIISISISSSIRSSIRSNTILP